MKLTIHHITDSNDASYDASINVLNAVNHSLSNFKKKIQDVELKTYTLPEGLEKGKLKELDEELKALQESSNDFHLVFLSGFNTFNIINKELSIIENKRDHPANLIFASYVNQLPEVIFSAEIDQLSDHANPTTDNFTNEWKQVGETFDFCFLPHETTNEVADSVFSVMEGSITLANLVHKSNCQVVKLKPRYDSDCTLRSSQELVEGDQTMISNTLDKKLSQKLNPLEKYPINQENKEKSTNHLSDCIAKMEDENDPIFQKAYAKAFRDGSTNLDARPLSTTENEEKELEKQIEKANFFCAAANFFCAAVNFFKEIGSPPPENKSEQVEENQKKQTQTVLKDLQTSRNNPPPRHSTNAYFTSGEYLRCSGR